MSGIVNYNLQKAQPVSLSAGYVEQADPFLGMLPSAISNLAKAGAKYAKEAAEEAAAGRVVDYEQAVAELAASAETLEMTDVQKTQALEKIQAQFADVKASERSAIDNRYTSLSVAKDTLKKREEANVQAQIDYDKTLDEDFQQRFPTWAVTMTPEERVSKAKELTFKAGLLSDMITNPDIKQTDPIFQDTLTDLELMDIKNWLEGAKASMGGDGTVVSVASLADVQYQLTQKLAASGVDIRLASQTSNVVFDPLIKAAETYGKTADIALKDIDKSLELNMNPGYRYVSQHADMLAWVDPSVKRQFDITTAELLTNGSVSDSLMYQGGLTKLNGNSFGLGFTQLSGASRNDSPLQSLATMNIGSNVEKQNANLITGVADSNLTQKADAVANMSPADRLNALANDRGLLEAYNVAYNEYTLSADPDVRRAAKDLMLEKLQNSLAYATGMVKDDVKGFWTHAYQVKWEDNKVKLLDSDGDDITDDYWIAGNPQKQLKNNVQQIEEIAKSMVHLGATQAEIDNAMNQVINESVGAEGRFESIGTAEDWGNAALATPGGFNDLVTPVVDLIVPVKEPGTEPRKTFSGGAIQSSEAYATSPEAGIGSSVATEPSVGAEYSSDVTPVATEKPQSSSNTSLLDRAGEASLELFRLAGEGWNELPSFTSSAHAAEIPAREKAEAAVNLQMKFNELLSNTDGDSVYLSGEDAKDLEQLWKQTGLGSNAESFKQEDGSFMVPREVFTKAVSLLAFDEMMITDEGFVDSLYVDTEGKLTIGIGTNLDAIDLKDLEKYAPSFSKVFKENLEAIKKAVKDNDKAFLKSIKISEAEAKTLFNVMALRAYDEAEELTGKKAWEGLTAQQKQVLTSLVYNMGKEKTAGFGNMFAAILSGDIKKAAIEIVDSKRTLQVKGRALRDAYRFIGFSEEQAQQAAEIALVFAKKQQQAQPKATEPEENKTISEGAQKVLKDYRRKQMANLKVKKKPQR